jgi:hypothetical protein
MMGPPHSRTPRTTRVKGANGGGFEHCKGAILPLIPPTVNMFRYLWITAVLFAVLSSVGRECAARSRSPDPHGHPIVDPEEYLYGGGQRQEEGKIQDFEMWRFQTQGTVSDRTSVVVVEVNPVLTRLLFSFSSQSIMPYRLSRQFWTGRGTLACSPNGNPTCTM